MILSITVMSAWPVTTGTVSASQAATSASLPVRWAVPGSPSSPSRALSQASSRSAAPGICRSCEIGICAITCVSAPARSGTIRARSSRWQASASASWNRCASLLSSSGPRLLPRASMTAVTRGGALGGQVGAEHSGAAERQAQLQVAVAEVEVVFGVGLRGAPLLDRGGGDGGQVLERRPGCCRLEQDLVGLVAHLCRELPRPAGDRVRPGLGQVPRRDGAVQAGPLAELAHLPHRRPGVPLGHPALGGQPGRGGTVAVRVVPVGGVEAAQERGVRGGELALQVAEHGEHLAHCGGIHSAGFRGIQVIQPRLGQPQRLADAAAFSSLPHGRTRRITSPEDGKTPASIIDRVPSPVKFHSSKNVRVAQEVIPRSFSNHLRHLDGAAVTLTTCDPAAWSWRARRGTREIPADVA